MINLERLAQKLNELIGEDNYAVYLYSNSFPDNIGERNIVTLNVTRSSLGYREEELDAETLTLTLTFDLPCHANGVVRDFALEKIQTALLGHIQFKVTDYGTSQENAYGDVLGENAYIVNAFFEQQPLGQPYVDSGRKTQQVVISGRALVQNERVKAVIGNDVGISLDGTPLLKVNYTASLAKATDTNIKLSEDDTLAQAIAIAQTPTKQATFLYLGYDIEDKLLSLAEGVTDLWDINNEHTLIVSYPSFQVKQSVKILNAEAAVALGVFLQYTLTMQVISAEVVRIGG